MAWSVELGCESMEELAALLQNAPPHDLREVAMRVGIRSCAQEDLVQRFVSQANFVPESDLFKPKRARRQAGASELPAAAPRLPAARSLFPGSPLRAASAVASKTFQDLSDSSSEDSSSEEETDARPTRLPLPAISAASNHSHAELGFQVLRSRIQLSGNPNDTDAHLTMAILEEALQVPAVRPGVIQLFEALAVRAGARPVKAYSLSSGTFHATVHMPSAGSGGHWTMSKPSYMAKRRTDVSAELVVRRLVASMEAVNHGGADADMVITLEPQLCSALATASAVYGWAELWSGGGARAMFEIWAPLLNMQADPSQSAAVADEILAGATGLALGNIIHKVGLCDDEGAMRLVSVALVTLVAVAALREAMSDDLSAAAKLLVNWKEQLMSNARLVLLISQDQANRAILVAKPALATAPTTAARAVVALAPESRPTSKVARKGHIIGSEHNDELDKFAWCSNCRSPTHNLWDCISLGERITGLRARGKTADQLITKLVGECRVKWSSKGPTFASEFAKRPGWTVAALKAKHAP